MAEYTKIETARAIICDFCNQLYSDEPCEPADCDWLRMLDEDAADVAPVVHARWIEKSAPARKIYFECSHCGAQENKHTAIKGYYCWRCGAKMDGGADNATDWRR